MRILDGNDREVMNPDLTKGKLLQETRTEHHEAITPVEEQWHYEVIAEYPNGGKDVAVIVDVAGVEGKPAWDEEETILRYIPYTPEEMEQIWLQPSPVEILEAQIMYTAMMTDTLLEV